MFNTNIPDEIISNLYIGNIEAACNEELLQQLGIEVIVQVLSDTRETRIFKSFKYYEIGVADWPTVNITKYLPAAISFIHTNLRLGKKVFVHCVAGVSRSPTVVIAYLMVSRKMSYDQALAFVQERRPVVNPNHGFEMQLRNLDTEFMLEDLI